MHARAKLSMLDIGCGDGHTRNWYRELDGYQIKTYGIDFDKQSVEKAKAAGHHVYFGMFENAPIPSNFFDLVVATHVIEHTADPKRFALTALHVLKPGGVFFCETPNANSLDAKIFRKKHWGAVISPSLGIVHTAVDQING